MDNSTAVIEPSQPIHPPEAIHRGVRHPTDLLEEPVSKKPRTELNCYLCGTTFSERRSLVRHQKTPTHCARAGLATPLYTCTYCSGDFSRKDLRSRHEKEVHFNIKRSTGPSRPVTVGTATTSTDGSNLPSLPQSGFGDTPSTSSVSPNGLSCVGAGTQSTPETDLEVKSVPQDTRSHDTASDEDTGHYSARRSVPTQKSSMNEDHDSTCSEGPPPLDYESKSLDGDEDLLLPDAGSIRSISTIGSIKSRLLNSNILRSALIYKGASPRLRGYKLPVLCVLCSEHLGSNITEVRAHLDKHSKSLNERFRCTECQVTFAYERDMILHQKAVARGDCGFSFEHIEPCNGHHPPDVFSEMLTDNDRMQFTVRLQHWEQAQLKIYLNQVNDLTQGDPVPKDNDCWSIDALYNSLISLSSELGHRKPRSAMEPGEQLSRLDNSRLTAALAPFSASRRSRNLATIAFAGDIARLKLLVLSGSDIDAIHQFPRSHKRFAGAEMTAIEAAIEGGHPAIVTWLGRQGARVNKVDVRSHSSSIPLIRAVGSGRHDIVRFLLDRGAHVNLEIRGFTASQHAVRQDDQDMLKLLLSYGADTDRPLRTAIARRNVEMVGLLLASGANVYTEPVRSGVLDNATASGNFEILRLVTAYALGRESRSDAPGGYEFTPDEFKMLAVHRDIDDVRNMVGRNVCKAKNFDGLLHYAACHGRIDIVDFLRSNGADPNSKFGPLDYPLAWATSQDRTEVVKLLLDRGANIHNWSGLFRSGLECAVMYERAAIASMIIARGGDVTELSKPLQRRCSEMVQEMT